MGEPPWPAGKLYMASFSAWLTTHQAISYLAFRNCLAHSIGHYSKAPASLPAGLQTGLAAPSAGLADLPAGRSELFEVDSKVSASGSL